jgi:glycosyltransferase involved in cell wall biosynthesis
MEEKNMKEKIFIISPQLPSNPNGGAKIVQDRLKLLSEHYDLFMLVRDKFPEKAKKLEYLKWLRVVKKTKPYNFLLFLYRYFILSIFLIYFIVIKERIKIIQLEYYDNLIYSLFLLPLRLFRVKIFYTAHDVQCLYFKEGSFKFLFTKLIEKIFFIFFVNYIFVWGEDDFNTIYSWGNISSNKIKIVPPIIITKNIGEWQLNDEMNFVFMGSFGHLPNREALNFLLERIWPKIKLISPDSKLYLILGVANINLSIQDDNVINCGFVDNPMDVLKKCNLFIAPIISGTGIKVKIIESFSYGIPLISTTLGFRNFSLLKNNYLLANNEDEFLQEIEKIVQDKKILERASEYEKKYFINNFYLNNLALYKNIYSLK